MLTFEKKESYTLFSFRNCPLICHIIILIDYNYRTLVSFGPKNRYLGEAAKTQEISNFKNTIGSLKRFAGRNFHDKEIHEIEKQFINSDLVEENGRIAVKV